jgi:hypothetical protein
MAWPQKQSYDDGDSLKLEVGKIVKVQLLEDEPENYFTHFIDGKSQRCSAPDCTPCIQKVRRDEKGSMKVVDTSDGKEKKLKGTAALFMALHEAVEMCGGRKSFIFAMKATGEKKDRRYHVSALPLTTKTTSGKDDPEVEDVFN